jgi:diadenylate cyclase
MNLLAILSNIGLPDVLDILFISMVSYQLYIWFWGTKAFKALIGIVLLSGIFIVAKAGGLFLTTWVFQILWQVFVILWIETWFC